MFSNGFALMPPKTTLARQSNRTTVRISAPCAISSSIAVIWTFTSYSASRSRNVRCEHRGHIHGQLRGGLTLLDL